MQLGYGSVLFPVNAADVSSRVQVVRSQSGRPLRYVHRLDVKAIIDGSGQAQLSALEAAFRVALLDPYHDLVLYQDSGAASGTTLFNRASLSGTAIVDGPHFEESQGPEYVVLRTVRFAMEATFAVRNQANAYVQYQSAVQVQGTGGPVRVWRRPLNARPIRQQVTPFSTVRVVQQGFAVGHSGYPAPDPHFVDRQWLVHEAVSGADESPTPLGRAWVDWPRRWVYVYELPFLPVVAPRLPLM